VEIAKLPIQQQATSGLALTAKNRFATIASFRCLKDVMVQSINVHIAKKQFASQANDQSE